MEDWIARHGVTRTRPARKPGVAIEVRQLGGQKVAVQEGVRRGIRGYELAVDGELVDDWWPTMEAAWVWAKRELRSGQKCHREEG